MTDRPKRTAKLTKPSAEVQAERDAFEKDIRQLFGFSCKILQTAAITSLETLQDPWKQDCITFYSGRRSVYLAKAAERHPEYFHADKSPYLEDLLALFTLAQLSRKKDKQLFAWWQKNYNEVSGWDLIEAINELKGRHKRVAPNAIVIKQAKVKFDPECIEVKPMGQKVAGRSNGVYKVELEQRKRKE